MPTIIRVVGILFVAVLCASGARPSEVASSPLQLVGTAEGREYRDFVVERGQILVRDGATTSPLPARIRWRLDGDLRAARNSMFLFPSYEVVQCEAADATLAVRTRKFAIVGLSRDWPWTDRELSAAIAVFAWMVDGNCAEVAPMASSVRANPAAMAAFELSPEISRGIPFVMLVQKGGFVSPQKWFGDAPTNDALQEIYFGAPDQQGRSLSLLQKAKARRGHGEVTLLHLAARGGSLPAAQELLKLGVNANAADSRGATALHFCGQLGHRELAALLLSNGARRSPWDLQKNTPFEQAVQSGHLELANDLLGEKPGGELRELLELAVRRADAKLIRSLLARGASRYVPKLSPTILGENIAREDVEIMDALREAGWKEPTTSRALTVETEKADKEEPVWGVREVDTRPEIKSAQALSSIHSLRPEILLTQTSNVISSTDGPVQRITEIDRGNLVHSQTVSTQDDWAVLSLLVENNGTPSAIKVVEASQREFGEAVRQAARMYEFLPGQRAGHVVRTRMTLVITGRSQK